MKVLLAEDAYRDLEDIEDYLFERNPEAAFRILDELLTLLHGQLSRQPRSGRKTEVKGVRELVWPPYVIPYEIIDDVVHIQRVWHAARDPKVKLKKS